MSLTTFVTASTTSEFTLPSEWDQDTEMLNDEELSASSNEEASKVLEQWQADQDHQDLELMEVDEQIGSNLLGDEIFGEPCVSPTGPLEELVLMNVEDDGERFFTPILEEEPCEEGSGPERRLSDSSSTSSLSFDERYQATLAKLQESMERSQETRKSLTMKTSKTEKYARSKSITGTISAIEKSSRQIQSYLKHIQQRQI